MQNSLPGFSSCFHWLLACTLTAEEDFKPSYSPHSYLLTTHHHVITQRPSHPAHTADPGTTEPTKHLDYVTACRPTSTTCHNQTSEDHCPHSIHRSAR